MPYQLTIPLFSESGLRPQPEHQRALHAVFFAALQLGDPALSEAIHDLTHKPFTQALLSDRVGYQWRLTLLDDRLYEPLTQGLMAKREVHLLHDVVELQMDKLVCIHEPYTELANVPLQSTYRYQFLTPTCFRQKLFIQPLPDPYSCFQSWWSRWQQFAPPMLSINVALLDMIRAYVAVGHFQLSSQSWADGKRRLLGATGYVTFLLRHTGNVEEEWWYAAASLAAFASYSGTGYKTTQGLGQTRLKDRTSD